MRLMGLVIDRRGCVERLVNAVDGLSSGRGDGMLDEETVEMTGEIGRLSTSTGFSTSLILAELRTSSLDVVSTYREQVNPKFVKKQLEFRVLKFRF